MTKTISKKVTNTTVKMATIELVDGEVITTELEPLILIGNVTMKNAQRKVDKEIGNQVRVLEVETETNVYEMLLNDFIKNSTIKGEMTE